MKSSIMIVPLRISVIILICLAFSSSTGDLIGISKQDVSDTVQPLPSNDNERLQDQGGARGDLMSNDPTLSSDQKKNGLFQGRVDKVNDDLDDTKKLKRRILPSQKNGKTTGLFKRNKKPQADDSDIGDNKKTYDGNQFGGNNEHSRENGFNITHTGGNILGIHNTHGRNIPNIDSKSSSSPASSSNLNWVYGVATGAVLFLAVSAFVALRLRAKRESSHSLTSLNNNILKLDDLVKSCKPISSKEQELEMNSKINSSNDCIVSNYSKTEAQTQTEGNAVPHKSNTVFGTPWQFVGAFTSKGGILQREKSDVVLVVPTDSIQASDYVQIHGAVFTDVLDIRRKFAFSQDEMLITPLVEYHAEGNYQFQQYVTVKLPHALPEDFDAAFIKVYTFTVDECGNIVLQELTQKSKENKTLDAYWEISQQEQCVIVRTTHFSGYFCTNCDTKTKIPSIYARVFGSHLQIKPNHREIRLILYLWDRRINIKDFIEAIMQQEIDMDRQLLADEPVPLLANASSDSSILMRMETLGDPEDQKCWRHVTRSNTTRPLFKPLQLRRLRQIVLCCQENGPMRVEWVMETIPETSPSNVFQCLIEMVNVPDEFTNCDDAFDEADEENIRTFYIRNLKLAKESKKESHGSLSPSSPTSDEKTLMKTLSKSILREELENICQAFGLNKKDIGNLSRKFRTEEDIKLALLEECYKACGVNNFVTLLPHILTQMRLSHVSETVQAHNLLSSLRDSKRESVSHLCSSNSEDESTARLKEFEKAVDTQTGENTSCKTLANLLVPRSQQCSNAGTEISSTNLYSHMKGRSGMKLKIDLNQVDESGTQVSPDSDYSSPYDSREGDYVYNGHDNFQFMTLRSRQMELLPHSSDNNEMIQTSQSNRNSNVDNVYTLSDTIDANSFDLDSCLATIDSGDFVDNERLSTLENCGPDSNISNDSLFNVDIKKLTSEEDDSNEKLSGTTKINIGELCDSNSNEVCIAIPELSDGHIICGNFDSDISEHANNQVETEKIQTEGMRTQSYYDPHETFVKESML